MSHEMAAAKILAGNRYLTLATVGDIGPWATPLAYTVDPDMTLVFYSAADSLHCTNIARHPKVSGAIFDSREPSDTATGIQFIGSAREVVPQQLEDTMERYFVQSFPDTEVRSRWLRPRSDFELDAPQRFYRIELERVFKPDPTSQKIDRRIEVSMDELRRILCPA